MYQTIPTGKGLHMEEARLLVQRLEEDNSRFLRQIDGVFGRLTELYPSAWKGFLELNSIIHGEQTMWGQVGKPTRELSQSEKQAEEMAISSAAQAWCDRMAAMIRGIARIAAIQFPELGNAFGRVAMDAQNLLEDYKKELGNVEMVESAMKDIA